MSSAPRYISLINNKLALQELLDQITYVIDQGLGSLKLKGALSFVDDVVGTEGGLRYNKTRSAIEYSNDGGTTWNVLSSDTFWWASGVTYSPGTIVLHTTGWYVCAKATSTAVPGSSDAWKLLTVGSIVRIVQTSGQLQDALECTDTNVSIYLKGTITEPVTATVMANNVTIWSDEATSIAANITLTSQSTTNIYWHSNGSKVTGNITIQSTQGTLWIERLTLSADALAFVGNIKYQRIEGAGVTGGTRVRWVDYIPDETGDFVPKDLSTLPQATYSTPLKLYVNKENTYGYITCETLVNDIAPQAATYFQVNMTAPLASRPTQAARGYVFFATDTGDLYIMGNNNVWGPAVHIRGDSGTGGGIGYTIMPSVSQEGIISWTAQLIEHTESGPVVPSPVNIKGPAGDSAFVIWKQEMGTPESTVEDFLEALGIGNRKMLFTKTQVSANIVTFQSKYPFIAIRDNTGVQWPLSAGQVTYTDTTARVNISEIIEAKGLGPYDKYITTSDGNYTRYTAGDTTTSKCWKHNDSTHTPSKRYTELESPLKDALAYESSDLTGSNLPLLSDYTPAGTREIEGNWYGLFGGGGGNDGGTGYVEIVEVTTLESTAEATIEDVTTPYFTAAPSHKYERDEEHDPETSYAWVENSVNVYTADEEPEEEDEYYSDTACEIVAGVVQKYIPISTALERKYKMGIPGGSEGASYGTPADYDSEKVYKPLSRQKRYYDVVLHQGGSWVYIASTESSGHTPPELPTTSDAWWQLMASPGEDIGTGITIHKFELRKPASVLNLFLQVKMSPSGIIGEARMVLDTLTSASARTNVKAWNKTTSAWDTMPDTGLGTAYDNTSVSVDFRDIATEKYLFYRWVTESSTNVSWHSSLYPNSNPIEYELETTPECCINFTAQDVRELIYIDVSPAMFILAVVDNNNIQYIVDSKDVTYDFTTNTTTVDLSSIFAAANVNFVTGTWKLVTNVGVLDPAIAGDHTHGNKPAIDLMSIDTDGNVRISGVIVVAAEDRVEGKYLIDPEVYASTTVLVDGGTYAVSQERVDPGTYNVIKVRQSLESRVYNSTMTILEPRAYSSDVTVIDPGELE